MRKRRPGSRVEGCRIAFVGWDPPNPEVSMPRVGEPRAIDTGKHDYFCSYQKLARAVAALSSNSVQAKSRSGLAIHSPEFIAPAPHSGRRRVGRAGDQQ